MLVTAIFNRRLTSTEKPNSGQLERESEKISILCTDPHEHFMVVAAECMAIKDNLEYRNFQLQPLQAHVIVRVIFSYFLNFLIFSFFVIFLILNACISWYTALFTHLSSWEKIHPFVRYLTMNNNQ